MPVPTAVPPTGNSSTACLARPARSTDSSNCRAKPPISWPKRNGVASARCVRPILMILSHCGRFVGQRLLQPLQRRDQLFADGHGHGHVDGRGERVVGALPHVDVVVRMDRLLRLQAVAAEHLDRPVGDHLVDVHVARGARAGLEDVDRELVVELALGHLAAGVQHGLDLLVVERVLAAAGELAQVAVGHAGGVFHQSHGMNQRFGQRPAGDGEILDGPLRLGAVIRQGGNANLSHGIAFDAEVGHKAKLLSISAVSARFRSSPSGRKSWVALPRSQ